MATIGDIITMNFNARRVVGLPRSPSTYGFMNLCFQPKKGTEYIVCGGDAQYGYVLVEKGNQDTPIGFCLLYIDGAPFIRVTQMNHEPEPVSSVEIVGKHQDSLPDAHHIGSVVVCYNVVP